MRVSLYTKPECSLCDAAKEVLQPVAAALGLRWDEVSIYDAAEDFERFRTLVPVLCVDGEVVLTLRFDASAVRAALSGRTGTVRRA